MSRDEEWTDTRRRRLKPLWRNGDRPRWNHAGVKSMFVTNLPGVARKENLMNILSKHGEVVDVYMETKRDVNKKNLLHL